MERNLKAIDDNFNLGYEELGGYELFTPQEEDLWNECFSRMDDFNQQLASISGMKNIYQKL